VKHGNTSSAILSRSANRFTANQLAHVDIILAHIMVHALIVSVCNCHRLLTLSQYVPPLLYQFKTYGYTACIGASAARIGYLYRIYYIHFEHNILCSQATAVLPKLQHSVTYRKTETSVVKEHHSNTQVPYNTTSSRLLSCRLLCHHLLSCDWLRRRL
jgi:hypothetical protein